MTASVAGDSSDEDLDWEEVHVPEQQQLDVPIELELSPPAPRQNIEITLQARPKNGDAKKEAAAAMHAQRILRTTSHKIHTVTLLANARIRNKWINNPLLHARLLSVTPLALQNGFAMIHKSRIPDQNKRGRLFEAAVDRLVTWWCETYFTVTPVGHIRSRTFEEVEDEIAYANGSDEPVSEQSGDERIRSVESLMKHVLMQHGSRDTSAQLFTALCRALDVPARLVVSLQSVPWKSGVGKRTVSKCKGKLPQKPVDGHNDVEAGNDRIELQDTTTSPSKYKGKGKEVTKPVKKRTQKSQSTGRSESPGIGARSLQSPDPMTTPPVFWTEVFSRPDSRWLPVDPIRGIVNRRHVFDPGHHSAASRIREDNRMLYVTGLEEDGFGRDITARYAREYTAKISKAQAIGTGSVGGRKEWWARVVQSITRPYRLQRDDLEDDELHMHQLTEGMPTTIAGFKNHPLYALVRHLRRDQVIDPPTELGKFRGEPVYPRSSVISLKTAENWLRQGRVIRQGCQPMKTVKQRAMTIGRQREVELALERARVEGNTGGDEELMQGLYAFSQTEVYTPEPIQDGKIPKNEFGNIDLYVPSMLPRGAVHIPFSGAAKIAKKLGFDYAQAVTGFEFRKRRAIPVIRGVVVAAENENVIVEACLEAEQDAEERARAKQFERACKQWIRLVHGLRIRERLQKQYASADTSEPAHNAGPSQQSQQSLQRRESWLDVGPSEQPGGFLTTADDVVKPFHLPRDIHYRYDTAAGATTSEDNDQANSYAPPRSDGVMAIGVSRLLTPTETTDVDENMAIDEVDVPPQPPRGPPKTMCELAESYAQKQEAEAAAAAPPREKKEDDLTPVSESDRVLEEGEPSRDEAPEPRTSKRRARTGRAWSSRKRARRRSESDMGVDEQDGTLLEHRPAEALSTPASGAVMTTPSSNPGSGRVLRPRPQKSVFEKKSVR